MPESSHTTDRAPEPVLIGAPILLFLALMTVALVMLAA